MASSLQATQRPADPAVRDDRDGVLEAFTGPERILAILPFVADVGSTPRWHHLLFTEDKILAIPANPEPAPEALGLFLPRLAVPAARYPSVEAELRLIAIPQPLTPAHVTAIVPYAMVRRARLTSGRGPQVLPELEIRAGRQTTWWFLQKEDETSDGEKACYARELLLSLLPFPVELGGFSDAPRPPEWRLRHRGREPLPLLPMPATLEAGKAPEGPEEPRAS